MRAQLTEDKRNEFALHQDTMDGDTAGLLCQISGLAALIREATIQQRVDEPMPTGVQEAISVIHDLAQSALKRAGCA